MEDSKFIILIVDDNQEILFNLELTLEFDNYQVITAKSGEEALKTLNKQKNPPDLILCDIMMPEMDGYEFFKKVSANPAFYHIPFIFLTAKSTPDDIRFGKMLGADDYITKPFNNEDLLATVAGKIARMKKNQQINQDVAGKLSFIKKSIMPSISDKEKKDVQLFWLMWDDIKGPTMQGLAPKGIEMSFSAGEIGNQLFHATVSIYGHQDYSQAEGTLLNIQNIGRDGYIYFDSIEDPTVRGNQRQFMLTVIAPKINYFESLKIKELFKEISTYIKHGKTWDIHSYREKIVEIMSSFP